MNISFHTCIVLLHPKDIRGFFFFKVSHTLCSQDMKNFQQYDKWDLNNADRGLMKIRRGSYDQPCKRVLWPSYLHNEISNTGKMTSLYWFRAQVIFTHFKTPMKIHQLTHQGQVIHILFMHQKTRPTFGIWMGPSLYVNQHWLVVNEISG